MTADEAQRTTLEKVRVLQRKLYRAAKAQPQRTFGVLFDKVCSLEVLWVAWAQVRRNRGAAGVDGETIESIEAKGTLWGSGANARVGGDDEEMQRFVSIEDLFKGRHFDRQISMRCVRRCKPERIVPHVECFLNRVICTHPPNR